MANALGSAYDYSGIGFYVIWSQYRKLHSHKPISIVHNIITG